VRGYFTVSPQGKAVRIRLSFHASETVQAAHVLTLAREDPGVKDKDLEKLKALRWRGLGILPAKKADKDTANPLGDWSQRVNPGR